MKVVVAESPDFAPRATGRMRAAGWTCEFFQGPLDALPAVLAGADGAIVRFGLRWDAERLRRAAGRLRFLAVAATGTDHIDRAAAAALGIEVVSVAGHPGLRDITATPEHAFGLLLALLRHTVPAHASVLRGEWTRDAFMGRQVRGSTVGVVGLGRTGRAFAAMAEAFGARVLYFDPHVAEARFPRCATLADLARASDVVAVHAVLDDSTRGLLDAAFFDALRPGAVLVNTARGAILDEAALLHALESGRLAGAALDVLCGEPEKGGTVASPLVDHARTHANLILTPHLGGATHESIAGAEELLADRLIERFGPAAASGRAP